MNYPIKAILFDMDGVLIDAKEWHYETLNRALNLFGMPISRSEHVSFFDGLPTKQKLHMLSKKNHLPEALHAFINEMKQSYTEEMIYQQCQPLFQHEYMMKKLREEGYSIAVCSNSIRKTVQLMMEKSNLLSYLDFLLSNQDVKKSKPAPDIYLKAMEMLQLPPQACLIVEDNENGIKAAKQSGGHLLEVSSVLDVNWVNIQAAIKKIEMEQKEPLHV